MSAKAIREYHGKKLLSKHLSSYCSESYNLEDRVVLLSTTSMEENYFELVAAANPWLLTCNLVVKPDQLIKRRGKAGLLGINMSWQDVIEWVKSRMNKEIRVEMVSGVLNNFIVEPFVPHPQSDEYYVCIQVQYISYFDIVLC